MRTLYFHRPSHQAGHETMSMKYVMKHSFSFFCYNLKSVCVYSSNFTMTDRKDCLPFVGPFSLLWSILLLNITLLLSATVILMFYDLKYLVVGGWENERTLIRRKRQDNDMTVQYTSNVLSKDDPVQLLIEITNGMCFLLWDCIWHLPLE